MSPLERLAASIRFAQLVADQQYLLAAKVAAELLVDLAPVEDLKAHLDDAAAKRANAIADIAEFAKVGL